MRLTRAWAVSAVVALALGGLAPQVTASGARAILEAHGIGTARFGAPRALASGG